MVDIEGDSTVTGLTAVASMSMRINGGYFVLRKEIFDYLNEGEDLVMDACIEPPRLAGSVLHSTTAFGPRWTRSRSGAR